jgi:hypothetical protein
MFDIEVFMASTSAWVVGCSTRSSSFFYCRMRFYGCLWVGYLGYMHGLGGCLRCDWNLTSGHLR